MSQTSDVKTEGQTDRQTRLDGHGHFVFLPNQYPLKELFIKIQENIQTLYLKYLEFFLIN